MSLELNSYLQFTKYKEKFVVVACFKKGLIKDKNGNLVPESIYADGIMKVTGSPHCHMELYFPWNRMSYSSSEDDGGERCKQIDYSHPDRWDFVIIDVRDKKLPKQWKDTRELYATCFHEDASQYQEYDWTGIVLHELFRLPFQDDSKLYCSEACMKKLGFKDYSMNPGLAYKTLKELGFKEIE